MVALRFADCPVRDTLTGGREFEKREDEVDRQHHQGGPEDGAGDTGADILAGGLGGHALVVGNQPDPQSTAQAPGQDPRRAPPPGLLTPSAAAADPSTDAQAAPPKNNNNTAAILLSQSGETKDLYNCLQILNQKISLNQ